MTPSGSYLVIESDTEKSMADTMIVQNLLGYVAVGRPVLDRDRVLQIVRKVREGYVTSDGQPCDGNGRIFR